MGTKKSLITADCPRCGRKHTKIRIHYYGPTISIGCPKCRFTVHEDDDTLGVDALIEKWNHIPRMEGILSEEALMACGYEKVVELFGEAFVDKYKDCKCISRGYFEDGYMYFIGYHVEDKSYPRKGTKYKGWPFWLALNIDYFTGKTNIEHCCLPDGRRITK